MAFGNGSESHKKQEELLQSLVDLQLNSEESPLYDNSELRTVQAALNMETPGTNPADLPHLQPQAFLNDFNNLFPSNPFAFDPNQQNFLSGPSLNQFPTLGSELGDDELISDEEFQKKLTDQEKTIFEALVIAINQTHIIRMKKFQQRRMEYLQRTMSQNESKIEQEAVQTAMLKAMAGYQQQLMAAGLGGQGHH